MSKNMKNLGVKQYKIIRLDFEKPECTTIT